MGEGKETKTRVSPHVEVQERGEIFFFYRPKVNMDAAHSVDDIQRTYIVLRPESGERAVEVKQSSECGKEAHYEEGKEGEGKLERGNGDEEIATELNGATELTEEKPKAEEEATRGNADDAMPTDETHHSGHDATGGGGQEAKAGLITADADEHLLKKERVAVRGTEEVELSKKTLLRLIVMGRKSLPDPSKRSHPHWGFVELVTTDVSDIKGALAAEEYDTKTRGHRTKPACRPVGEGIYRLLRHKDGGKVHTHLIYKLELPDREKGHEPQETLNIESEGSYLIQIKNPNHGGPPSAGLQNKRKATYPAHLQGQIGPHRFVAADPPDFLNYEGCEFILISASDDIEEELGLELEPEQLGSDHRSELLSLFGDSFSEAKVPITPLIEGEWA